MSHHLITDPRAFDLDAYLARVGYTGSRTATLETLRALHLRHTLSIPFENLSPLLRWPVRLDTASLVEKLVRGRRGGYCFEQNLLFAHALQALGFRLRGLAARVVYNQPPGTINARTHMLLTIELDEADWIADVGFGGLTLTAPLRVETGTGQPTPHETFRLVAAGEGYQLEAYTGAWAPLYRFTLESAYLPDYELASWHLCNHPGSHFVAGLIAARPLADGRVTLRNGILTIHHLSGVTERRSLTSSASLRATLEGRFGVDLPRTTEVEAALGRITAPQAA